MLKRVLSVALTLILTVMLIPTMVPFSFAEPDSDAASEPAASEPIDPSAEDEPSDGQSGNDEETGSSGSEESGAVQTDQTDQTEATTEEVVPETPVPAFCQKAPASVKIKKLTKRSKKITWKKYSGADGYQVQYTSYRSYRSKKTKTIKGGKKTSLKIKKLKKKTVYFARVRAYKNTSSGRIYSKWGWSSNHFTTRAATVTRLKCGSEVLNIRKMCDIPKTDFGTLQGGCTDGTYTYQAMAISKKKLCDFENYPQFVDASAVIVKIRLSDRQIISMSSPMPIGHANALAYDKHKGKIIVTNNMAPPDVSGEDVKKTMRLSIVDPETLEYEGYHDVVVPQKLKGATQEQRDSIQGLCGVAYCPEKRLYVANISATYDFMLLDSEFNPIEFIKAEKIFQPGPDMYSHQQMDVSPDFIMTVISPNGQRRKTEKNKVAIYTWEGKYMCNINLLKGYEIENVFHIGTKHYSGYYDGHYYTNDDGTMGFAKNAYLYQSIF